MSGREAEEAIVKKHVWTLAIQLMACAAVSLAGMVLKPVRWAHAAFLWALVPLAGLWTAYRAVRRGVNPYASWILPPVAETLAGLLASMGYVPNAGGVLLTALFSLIGGAAGDVVNRQTRRRGK